MKRKSFGATWWGKEWINALETRARLDPNRLPRGRTYARQHRVGALTVAAGMVTAAVQGSRVTPYIVQVRVRTFTDDEWDRVYEAIVTRAAHLAALLDGELLPEVVADASAAGVSLLPEAGDVTTKCSCPDWANPCKHAAAVVYLMADELDRDPFALLQLRGRNRSDVLAELRRRRATTPPPAAAAAATDAGVLAREAFAAVARPPLPAMPLPPRQPGEPTPLGVPPPPHSKVRAADLVALATDAARRAWAVTVGEGNGGLDLDASVDLLRLVADSPTRIEEIARSVGMSPAKLARRAAAWRRGGADAVDVLTVEWRPDPEEMEEALVLSGRWRLAGNRVTLGPALQLRLGRGGAWYRFERAGGAWEMTAGPASDPAALVE